MSTDAQEVARIESQIKEKSRELRELMMQLRRAHGDKDPTTFLEIELVAGEAAKTVAREIIAETVKEQADQWRKTEEVVTCPECGKSCRERANKQGGLKKEQRRLKTLHGEVPLEEPTYWCSACRRVFFPSTC